MMACLTRWGLDRWTTGMGTRELRRGRTLLRSLVTSWSESRVLPAGGLRALNAGLSVPVRRSLSRDAGGWHLEIRPIHASADWVGMAALESFAKTFAEDDPQRIKVCPNEACRWVFFDETARNIRKWCHDAACGNRDRVRRSRERARA